MSALSEIAHDIAIGESIRHAEPEPRLTIGEWHAMVEQSTVAAMKLNQLWGGAYRAIDAALRAAMPDRDGAGERDGADRMANPSNWNALLKQR